MRFLKLPFVTALFVLLAGCALLGVEKPETFNQRLAYAYGAQIAVAEQIANQTRSGVMSSEDNERFVAMVENAKEITDSARDIVQTGDTAGAEARLRLAQNILVEVDQYVRRQQ